MAAAGGGGAGSHSSSSSGHSWPWPAAACPSHPLRGQKRDESEARDRGIPGVSGQEPPSSPLAQDRPPSPTLPKEPGLWAVPPATRSPARQPSRKQRHPGRGVLPRPREPSGRAPCGVLAQGAESSCRQVAGEGPTLKVLPKGRGQKQDTFSFPISGFSLSLCLTHTACGIF